MYKKIISDKNKNQEQLPLEKIWQNFEKIFVNGSFQEKFQKDGEYKKTHFISVLKNEIVCDSATSIYSNRNINELDGPTISNIAKNYLKEKKINVTELPEDEKLKLYENFLAHMSTMEPYRRQQTSHPTQTLSTQAIEAKEKLQEVFIKHFDAIQSGNIKADKAIYNEVAKATTDFYDALNPPESKLTRDQESARDLRQSRHVYNTVPEFSNQILSVAKEVFKIDVNSISLQKQNKLFKATTDYVANSMQVDSWALDADGKLETDPVNGLDYFRKSNLSINQQYIQNITELNTKIDASKYPEQTDRLKGVVWSAFGVIERIYPLNVNADKGTFEKDQTYRKKINKYIGKELRKNGASNEVIELIQDIWKQREEARPEIDHIRRSYQQLSSRREQIEQAGGDRNTDKEYQIYKESLGVSIESFKKKYDDYRSQPYITPKKQTAEDIDNALMEVVKAPGINEIKYTTVEGKSSDLPLAHAISAQVKCFQNTAERAVYRQSSDVFEMTVDYAMEHINKKFEDDFKKLAETSDVISDKNGRATKFEVMKILLSDKPEHITLADQIKQHVSQYVSDEIDDVYVLKQQLNNLGTNRDKQIFFDKNKNQIYGVETLEMFRMLADHHDSYAFTLISETKKPEDVFNCGFCEELMIERNSEASKNRKPKVTLIEYRGDVRKSVITVNEVLDKDYSEPLITEGKFLEKYNEETQKFERKTIKDLMEQTVREAGIYGKSVKKLIIEDIKNEIIQTDFNSKESDFNKRFQNFLKQPVKGAIISMIAGSDSEKSASSNILPVIDAQFAYQKIHGVTKGIMIENEMGSGTSYFRNAVHNYMTRTRQGKENDVGPLELTAENDVVIAINASKKVFNMKLETGAPENDKERFLVAINNIGNRANLNHNISEYNMKKFVAKANKGVNAYGKVYDSKEFSLMVEFVIPKDFDNAVSLGARSPFRPGSSPEFSVNGQRAIGHGAGFGFSGFSQRTTITKISELLSVDANGNLKDAKKALKAYIDNPDIQNLINRGVSSIISHYQPDVAWNNVAAGLGLEKHCIKLTINHNVLKTGDKKFNIDDLVNIAMPENSEINDDLKNIISNLKEKKSLQNSLHDILPNDLATTLQNALPKISEEDLINKLQSKISDTPQNKLIDKKVKSLNKKRHPENKIDREDLIISVISQTAAGYKESEKLINAVNQLFEAAVKEYGIKIHNGNKLKLGKTSGVDKLVEYIKIISPDRGFQEENLRKDNRPLLELVSKEFGHICDGTLTELPKSISEFGKNPRFANLYHALATLKNTGEMAVAAYKNTFKAVDLALDIHKDKSMSKAV